MIAEILSGGVVEQQIRAQISNAFYDARNAGQTMEAAADDATDRVIRVLVANGIVERTA